MNRSCRIWLAALVVFVGCASAGPPLQVPSGSPMRVRTISAAGPHRFHRPVTIQVGWQAYQDQIVAQGVLPGQETILDSSASGATPVLVLHYLDDAERIYLPMGIDDALLGRLIKSTAMTEMPVEEPLGRYLERAECANCHPPSVPLD